MKSLMLLFVFYENVKTLDTKLAWWSLDDILYIVPNSKAFALEITIPNGKYKLEFQVLGTFFSLFSLDFYLKKSGID